MHQSSERRPARRLASWPAVLGLALGLVLLADGTAFAKSEVAVGVSAHALRLGRSVTVTGTGGDDSARVTYLCVDARSGSAGWHLVGCNWTPYHAVSVSVRATRRGPEQFRARLLARRSFGGPLVLDRISATTTVLVH